MRSLLRAGLLLGFVVTACKDAAAPGDFTDPATVRVNGRTVATLHAEGSDPGVWVDAGGEALTAEDVEALEALETSAQGFQDAVNSIFLPIETFFGG